MKQCPYCGEQLDDQATVCPNCGQNVAGDENEDYTEPEALYEETIEQPIEETIDEAADEIEEKRESVKRPVRKPASKPKREKPSASEEEAGDDPLLELKKGVRTVLSKPLSFIAGKDAEIKGWQIAVAGISLLSAVIFIVAACCGAVYSLAGAAASLTLGYFELKKPKFSAACMLIPIILFMLMSLSLGATYHGTVDFSAKVSRMSKNVANYDALASLETPALRMVSEDMLRYGFSVSAANSAGLFSGSNVAIDYNPVGAFHVIFRIVTYAMAILFVLSQLGIIRRNDISSYLQLGLSLIYMLYAFVMVVCAGSAAVQLFFIAAFGFMLCWFIFALESDKGRYSKKSKLLARLFSVNPAPAKDYQDTHPYDELGGALMAARIIAYVIAGVLAALGIYIIVLMIVSLSSSLGLEAGEGLVYVLISLFQALLLSCAGYFAYLLGNKIAARDDSFLKHYHVLAIAIVCIVFTLCSTPIISGWALVLITLGSAVLLAAGTVYFVLSKRVYVYMDTNRYLTQSSFTKKINPPKL